MTEATEKLTLLYFYECKYNQKGVNSLDFERIDSFSFWFYYSVSLIKVIIRFRFTAKIAMAPCICMPNKPAYYATS